MANMDDLRLARLLQEQFDREAATQLADSENVASGTNSRDDNAQNKSRDLSPVDPSLELSDPNPNILTMFLEFNERYFWGRLSSIEVKWSPRMTLCAGLCVYEGRGGLCSVRLSTPLLKLRPRKDLVETLLHEMIHAYLFITDNDRDHDGHGPNFKNHMNRINKVTGANISIYHNFHDEVESYQQHWWRCNGPCQNRKPYFGYVKRAMNREPSPRDTWWQEHQMTCGGKFAKIKEPESYTKKKQEKEAKEKNKSLDIRAFVGKGNTLDNKAGVSQAGNKSTSRAGTNTDKWKALVAGGGAQNGVVVNGVLIRKGAAPSNPLFSTIGSKVLSKTSSDVVDLTMAECDDFEKGDDSWMLEADSGENVQATDRTGKNSNPDIPIENKKIKLIDTTNERRSESVCNIIQNKVPKIPTKEPNKFKQGQIDQETNRLKERKGPNGFVSVCEPVDSLPARKTQIKFAFSESDSDSDLWEGDNKDKQKVNETDERAPPKTALEKINNRPDKQTPDNQTPDAVKTIKPHYSGSGIPMQELVGSNLHISASVGDKNINSKVNWSTKDSGNDKQRKTNELSNQSEELKFTGQGYKLGSAEQGSSYLSLLRKTFHSVSPETSQSTVDKKASATQLKYSFTANINKRKSSESDSSPEKIKRQKFDNLSQDSATGKKSCVIDGTEQNIATENCVACPVCNKLVETTAINSHLDKCLL